MTKKEIELVHAFTSLETAWAKLMIYDDQADDCIEISEAISSLKTKFYNILLEEEP